MPLTTDSVVDLLSQVTEELLGPYVERGDIPKKNLSKIYVIVQQAMMQLENLELEQDRNEDVNAPKRSDQWAEKDLSSRGMKNVPGSYK